MRARPLSDHRKRRLKEAAQVARGALALLDTATQTGDPDALAAAGAALQDAGRLASRYGRELGGIDAPQIADQLSPKGGPRRAAS